MRLHDVDIVLSFHTCLHTALHCANSICPLMRCSLCHDFYGAPAGATLTGRHEVFVDKQKRTWVSNLAAVQIASSADFQQTLDLVSSCRHRSGPSPGLSHLSHGPSTCIVTLLVTADIPAASLSAPLQSQSQSPDQALRGASQTQRRRVCSKLTFVEVGSSTVPVQAAPLGTVSAGRSMSKHHQLSRSSTSISTATSSAPRSSGGDRGGGLSRGGRETAAAARPIKSQVRSVLQSPHTALYLALHIHSQSPFLH